VRFQSLQVNSEIMPRSRLQLCSSFPSHLSLYQWTLCSPVTGGVMKQPPEVTVTAESLNRYLSVNIYAD
jgi:hypothetical protein